MSTQTNYNQSIFFVNHKNEIEETTLAAYLTEFAELDPSQAWYVKENDNALIVPAEEDNGEAVYGTRYEVRKNPHAQHNGNKLMETFVTEEEAEQYILDGLYWNWCNRNTNDPLHADTRADLEVLIAEEAKFQAENN